ncbi:hypothetical protein QFZ51_001727 [Chitinophaga sp. W3I9]
MYYILKLPKKIHTAKHFSKKENAGVWKDV